MTRFLFSIIILFISNISFSQNAEIFLKRDISVLVKDSTDKFYANPWGGGMNACQFYEIDLNFDGKKDLFVFDRSSLKILTFINNGSSNSTDYSFSPDYAKNFPKIFDWIILKDYNNDGKEDIFTYASPGIKVYKNISAPETGIRFEQVTDYIRSLQGAVYTNLLVTQVDYPAIADIDDDGDLDIITFWGLGKYAQYHRNMSMESYKNSDSLNFVLQENCWGKFAENENGNSIELNINCPLGTNTPTLKSGAKHTGSTLLAEDLDGDGDKDLIVGDVDFPNITQLTNGGNKYNAVMTAKDTMFPSVSKSVWIFSFPVMTMVDINNDNKKDLLFSPFEADYNVSENNNSCWLYKNTGSGFGFQQKNFLQADMIEVGAKSYPVLADYDGDGLKDLFVGNYGIYDSSYYKNGFLYSVFTSSITLYKNTGTKLQPSFSFVTDDFANLSEQKLIGIYPTFGDLDNDGDEDMIIGNSKGNLYMYENISGSGKPMKMTPSGKLPINVGNYSTPQLADINDDQLVDLIIGEKRGNLNFYKNTGSKATPEFTFETDSLGKINIIDYTWSNNGYSVPCFFKDSTNQWRLLVGSESGAIFYYKDIEGNLSGKFTLAQPALGNIYNGTHSAPAVGFLNNDKYPELITGNMSGGLCYYIGAASSSASNNEYKQNSLFVQVFPNPVSENLRIVISNNSEIKSYTIYLYSIIGKQIYSEYFENDKRIVIKTNYMPDGIYLLKITSDTGAESNKKIIINH